MLYLKRKIEKTLIEWSQDAQRKPLVLRGARQVGKTAVVRHVAETMGLSLAELNFERRPMAKSIFKQDRDPKRIVGEIAALVQTEIDPQRSLLFLDEIQDCPDAIVALRYFYEEMPQLRVIAAGSLLEFVLGDIPIPVGRVTFAYLYPMNFSEFLEATDRSLLVGYLPMWQEWEHYRPPSAGISESLRSALREYFVMGGMPGAVADYVQHHDLMRVGTVLDDLMTTYRQDIPKYARGEMQVDNLSRVLDLAFAKVGDQVKYSKLLPHDDYRRTKRSIELLEQAQILHRVRSSQGHGLPLGAHENENYFRLNFLDIGLGRRAVGLEPQTILRGENLLATYQGKLADQFVGQQLLSESGLGSQDRKLFCWMRLAKSSQAEVDFLMVRDGNIVPIEVKSGAKGSLKSLHLFLEKNGGVGLCLQDIAEVRREGQVVFAPLYTIL